MATKRRANSESDDQPKRKRPKADLGVDQAWAAMREDFESMEAENLELKVELERMENELDDADSYSRSLVWRERAKTRQAKMLRQQLREAQEECEKLRQQNQSRQGKMRTRQLRETHEECEELRQQNEALLRKNEVAMQALFAVEKFGRRFTGSCQEDMAALERLLQECVGTREERWTGRERRR